MYACDDFMRKFTDFVDTVVAANMASLHSITFCIGYLIGYLVSNILLLQV